MSGSRAILGAVVACAAQFLVGADGLAVAIALPSLREAALGYGPFEAGLAVLPLDLVAFVVATVGAQVVARRALLAPSFAVTAAVLLSLARAPVPAGYVRPAFATAAGLAAMGALATRRRPARR